MSTAALPTLFLLPRLTGEVARRAGGGEQQARYLPIPDLKFSTIVDAAFSLRRV
jgi:hypothetical protein